MKTAVVTGAASGIGRALSLQLAAAGHRVHLADVAPTDALADEIGGVPHHVDVSDASQVEQLAAATGPAEVVCLNAGIVGQSLGSPWEAPPEEWQRLVSVNLFGVINGLRAYVPRLLEHGHPARIVVTASLAGLVTFPGGGAYAATKHAVVAVAEQAALALEKSPVSVTLVCPALVRTGMSATGADPRDVATTALAAAAAGRFLVVPEEWIAAIQQRADHLTSGRPADPPTPHPTDTSQP
jgi:NAD(P)-dependent dehydrogenase (short-subunit alcohol dehydrogenase family)